MINFSVIRKECLDIEDCQCHRTDAMPLYLLSALLIMNQLMIDDDVISCSTERYPSLITD